MLSYAYFEAWLMAFVLTQAAEVPLYVWLAPVGVARAFALSLVLLAVSLAVIVGLRDRWLGRA